MCAGALYWSKIGRVVYGASDEKNGYRHFMSQGAGESRVFHPKTQLVHGVLADECAELVKTFFRNKRAI
jgi:tRNA(adenine34) deaminase